jgi:hypothetical protein
MTSGTDAGFTGPNAYKCAKCNEIIVTRHADPGVTPFMLACRATEGCGGVMESVFYRIPAGMARYADWEWYKPAGKELAKLSRDERDHVRKGGVLIRRCVPKYLERDPAETADAVERWVENTEKAALETMTQSAYIGEVIKKKERAKTLRECARRVAEIGDLRHGEPVHRLIRNWLAEAERLYPWPGAQSIHTDPGTPPHVQENPPEPIP